MTNSLTSVIMRTLYRQLTGGGALSYADAYKGLEVYRGYFQDQIAGKETIALAYSEAINQLIEALENCFDDREELELDAVVIGASYPTLNHYYEDAFSQVIASAAQFPTGVEGFFTEVVMTIGADIGKYDRKWLRDELGIRSTPNDIRPEDEALIEMLGARETVGPQEDEAYERLLVQTVKKNPDSPLATAQYVLAAEGGRDVAERAKKYLRPLKDYPAGKLGFYTDREVTDNWLAHCRALLDVERDAEVLPYAENLLRLGYDGPLMNTVIIALATGMHTFSKKQRAAFPLTIQRIDENSLLNANSPLSQMLELFGDGSQEPDMNKFLEILGPAMGVGPKPKGGATIRTLASASSSAPIFRIKITLKGSKPPIWRRLELRADTPLEELHALIQTVFEWSNSHLHSFENSRRDSFVSPHDPYSNEWSDSYEGMTVADMFRMSGKTFTYHYDFGDSWYHSVALEKELPIDKKVTYPRCTAGRCSAPVDDMGGMWSFYDFVEALKDPKHEMYADAVQWLGKGFDLKAFDLKKIDGRLAQFR
jgi:hypothetical protein